MKSTITSLLLTCVLISGVAVAKEAAPNSAVGITVSNAIIKRYSPTIDAMTHHGWDHSNSAILHGMEKVYNNTHDKKYLKYIKAYADTFISPDGSIKDLQPALDAMHPGVLCLFLYQQTGDKKYQLAAKAMRDYFVGTAEHPTVFKKTPEGGYWHKSDDKYKNVMTVDGLYMIYPFLVHYAVMFNEPELLDLAAQQILMVSEHAFNIKSNLPYHAWSYDKAKPWANPITGTSTQFWSRASGWYSMALVDVLEYFPPSHPAYAKLLFTYQSLAKGIKASQNPADGLWYQVLDAADQSNNYPDSSGSGMMIYSLKKGVNLKLIDAAYSDLAQKGWVGLQTKITTAADGGPQINSVAPPMGAQVDYNAYVAIRPVTVPSTDPTPYPHGYIGVLMAASVMDGL